MWLGSVVGVDSSRYLARMNFNPWIVGPVVVCVALPLMFGFILAVIAWLGGWSSLAREYRTSDSFPHPRLHMKSADLRGWCGYGNCLTFAADAEALYVGVVWPLGFGHPNLKLPWSEATAEQSTNWLGMNLTSLRFERVPNVKIRIAKKTADQLIAMARETRDNG